MATTTTKAAKAPATNIPAWVKNFDFVIGEETDEKAVTDFSSLLDTTSKGKNYEEGEVFEGTIISINDEFVTVDIGYKQEGLVLTREFKNYDGTLKIKVGEKIQ